MAEETLIFEEAVKYHIKERAYKTTANIAFTLVDPNHPENLEGATIKMWIAKPGTHTPAKELSTENAGIVITDAAAGKFSLVPFYVDIPPGNYVYDIKIIYANGDNFIRFEGKYEICQTATKC